VVDRHVSVWVTWTRPSEWNVPAPAWVNISWSRDGPIAPKTERDIRNSKSGKGHRTYKKKGHAHKRRGERVKKKEERENRGTRVGV